MHGRSSFNGTHFRALAAFSRFTGKAWFQDTTFGGYAGFDGCVFEGDVRLDSATFVGIAHLGATFKGEVSCPGLVFLDHAQIFRATFETVCNLGEILAVQGIRLLDTTFRATALLWIHSPWVSFDHSQFASGATIMLRGGDFTLGRTEFGAPSLISDYSDEPLSPEARAFGLQMSRRARLLTVQYANLAQLTLDDIDIADCRLVGGLDRLTLAGESKFPIKGSRWDWRRVIVDERVWRAAHSFRNWSHPAWTEATELQMEPPVPAAEQVAQAYRALRKGREDIKDEPGAADFYYGEMEMRRLSGRGSGERARGRVERTILTAYWLTSGYALRAGRAFLSLLLTVVLFGALLRYFGFDPKPPLATTLLYSAKSTSSLFRIPDTIPGYSLTYAGELLQLV